MRNRIEIDGVLYEAVEGHRNRNLSESVEVKVPDLTPEDRLGRKRVTASGTCFKVVENLEVKGHDRAVWSLTLVDRAGVMDEKMFTVFIAKEYRWSVCALNYFSNRAYRKLDLSFQDAATYVEKLAKGTFRQFDLDDEDSTLTALARKTSVSCARTLGARNTKTDRIEHMEW